MIQVKELRIGNYVLGQTKQITKVDGFFNGNKAIYTNVEDERVRFIIHYLNECDGVTITEEILLKCGFEKGYTKGVFKLGDFTIDLYSKTWKLKREWIVINFKYLHQLQNLYFALTNEELNVKL